MTPPTTQEHPTHERLVCNAQEAAQRLGLSKSSVYALVRAGDLRAVRAGARVLIPLSALSEFLGEVTPRRIDVA